MFKWLDSFKRKKMANAFDIILKEAIQSETYLEYTQKVHELDFRVFNLVCKKQFELLIDLLKNETETHFLDLGCGFGEMTLALAKRTEMDGFGFDFAPAAIKYADELKSGHFFLADFNDLSLELPTTKLFVSIDGLYLIQDFQKLFDWLKETSDGAGKLYMLRTEVTEKSPLFEYLKNSGIKYHITDLTNREHEYWQRAQKYLPQYKEQMIGEGFEKLYLTKHKEMQRHQKFIDEQMLKRFLVEISW